MGGAFGHDRPPKGGRSCPGEPTPCPNSAPPSSTPSAPPADPSPPPHATSASHARPPTSGSHDSMPNNPCGISLASPTHPRPGPTPTSNTPSSVFETNTAGDHARFTPTSAAGGSKLPLSGPSQTFFVDTNGSLARPRPTTHRPPDGSSEAGRTNSGNSTSRAGSRSPASASDQESV